MKGIVILVLVLLLATLCRGQDVYRPNYQSDYERFGSSTARWSTNPPRLYSNGTYLGELSSDRYAPDSISNPYGRFGSRYSPESINNPYGPFGVYSTKPIYVYPSVR